MWTSSSSPPPCSSLCSSIEVGVGVLEGECCVGRVEFEGKGEGEREGGGGALLLVQAIIVCSVRSFLPVGSPEVCVCVLSVCLVCV